MRSPETRFEDTLIGNAPDGHTLATTGTYPHIWPSDKAFAALGVVHVDPLQAAVDMREAFTGQWRTGMVPHMTYDPRAPKLSPNAPFDMYLWKTGKHPDVPKNYRTSGVATLPVLAEGCMAVMEELCDDQRGPFLQEVVPKLIDFHEWMYRERDFGGSGLVASIHPYETSVNGLPYWSAHLGEHPVSRVQSLVARMPVESLIRTVRRDKTNEQRAVSLSAQAGVLAVTAIHPLAKTGYDPEVIKEEWPHQIEDVLVNSVLVRNNELLVQLAEEANIDLSDELIENMKRSRSALDELYVAEHGAYFSREVEGKHLIVPTVASLMPIYSGAIFAQRVSAIAAQLTDDATYQTPYPVPTVPANSPFYNPEKEDLGAIKPTLNWLIAKGLLEAGEKDLAKDILRATYEMVANGAGIAKAYSAQTGEPLDKNQDSSTAAIARDAVSRSSAQIILFSALLHKVLEQAA